MLPYLCVIPATALFGYGTDWLSRRFSVLTARKLSNTCGFAVAACFWLCVPMAASPAWALGWLCMGEHRPGFGLPSLDLALSSRHVALPFLDLFTAFP